MDKFFGEHAQIQIVSNKGGKVIFCERWLMQMVSTKRWQGFVSKKVERFFLRALADVIKSCPKKVERLFCEHALMQIVSKKGGKLFLRALADYKSCRKKWQKVFVRKGGKVFLRALQIV